MDPGGREEDEARDARAGRDLRSALVPPCAPEHARRECEQRARHELVGPGVGAVVRAVRIAVAQRQCPQRRGERDQGDDRGHDDVPPARFEAAGAPREGTQRQRPDEVELLFDRERPELEHRVARDVGAEIAGRVVDEVPVRDVQERRLERADRVGHLQRRRDRDVDERRHDQGHERGGQQSPEPPRIEACQPDPAGSEQVPQEQLGHEVARQDEEDVDPDVAAGERTGSGVEQDDEVDGDGAQAVEVGAVPGDRGAVRCLVSPFDDGPASDHYWTNCSENILRCEPPLKLACNVVLSNTTTSPGFDAIVQHGNSSSATPKRRSSSPGRTSRPSS